MLHAGRIQSKRRRHFRRVASVAAMVGLGLGLVSCGVSEAKLTVPISSWPGYEYFYLAHRLGLDRAEGLEINPVQFADPQAIVHAYLRGDLSVAQLTTVEAVDICARDRKRCPVIVLILNESRGGDRIAIANGLPGISALRGKRVAVTYSTLGPYVLSRALEQNGLSLGDVKLADMPLSRMPDALKQGKVQAAVFFPPFSDYAARDGASHVVFDSRAIPEEVFDVLVVDPTFLKEHSRQLQSLIRVWEQAHQRAKLDRSKAVALMAAREQVSAKEFEASEQGLVYFPLSTQRQMLAANGVLSRNLKAVQAVQQRLKLLPPATPLPSLTSAFVEVD